MRCHLVNFHGSCKVASSRLWQAPVIFFHFSCFSGNGNNLPIDLLRFVYSFMVHIFFAFMDSNFMHIIGIHVVALWEYVHILIFLVYCDCLLI